MSHYNQLSRAFDAEWQASVVHAHPGVYMEHDGNRHHTVYHSDGTVMMTWESRPVPGCATLVITTHVELAEQFRGRRLGRFFREFRHRAYKRAGFQGELATVRADNERQNHLMRTMGGVPMGEFPSDYGGTYRLWLTKLPATVTVTGLTGEVAQVRSLRWVGEDLPDATTPPPIPETPRPEAPPQVERAVPGRRPKSFAHRKNV
jgi:hypothetical protein